MMTLHLMQAVVATVDDQWESPLADTLMARWAHDTGRAKFWRASANFVFFFKHAGQAYVLRFNHADERTAAMIEAEVAVVNALAAKGVRVAKPRRSLAGNDVESVETDVYPFVADIALALSDLFGDNPEQVDFQQETFLPFINGYRTARSLPEEELPFIPLFLRVQNLFTYARLQRALTPVDPAGEPPWMAGLRAKLATKMAVSRKGFVV